ncbi:BQ5605_C018g08679 [Microbotryum silenes-dioicae]|uniref:BQ5605_C018g08679 protein n=1 Tax=Microbotryum silenes-dioicae TaxID=796604 RepID=A0A2X0M0N9_9BASI|nr:BQ5605_C018g08679 [Microbotryum silenes-dioicae]
MFSLASAAAVSRSSTIVSTACNTVEPFRTGRLGTARAQAFPAILGHQLPPGSGGRRALAPSTWSSGARAGSAEQLSGFFRTQCSVVTSQYWHLS